MTTGFLALFNEPERLEVAPGFWIDVRTSLTAEDYAGAQRVLMGKMTMQDSKLNASPDTIAYQHELVFRGIVNWNLTDEEGVLLPLEPDKLKHDSINRLPQSVFNELYLKINAASTPRRGGEEAQFRAGSDSDGSGDEPSDALPVASEVYS
jgi:hypothetical protein